MNYWKTIERQVTEIAAERPTVDAYDNNALFAQWVQNMSPEGRAVLCGLRELKGASYCA